MHLYSIARLDNGADNSSGERPDNCADKSSGERSDNCADNSSGEANVAEATVSTLEQRKQRWRGDGEPETWPAQYPPDARVVMFAGADSRAKAIEILNKVREVCE